MGADSRMYPGPTAYVEFRGGSWVLGGEWSVKPYAGHLPDTLSGVRNMLAAMEADPSEQPQDGREGFGRDVVAQNRQTSLLAKVRAKYGGF